MSQPESSMTYPSDSEADPNHPGHAPGFSPVPEALREQLADLYHSRDWEQALCLGEDLARDYPLDTFAWKGLASVLLESGQWLRSRESLEQALSLDPNDPETHLILAEALCCLGRPRGALAHLEAARNRDPETQAGRYYPLLDRRRNIERVREHLEEPGGLDTSDTHRIVALPRALSTSH